VKWQAQWRCPDPRIFGDTRYASANLYVAPTGLTLPQTLPVTLTAQALGGTVTVFNPGTDPEGSPAIFGLSGEQQANVGLHNATTGKRVLFSFPLGADDTLAVDTERGGAYLNGEYRPTTGFSDMVSDMRLAPGVNVIRALGYAGSTGTPALTVSFRPASW
jgi:hypothetical protein